MTKYPRIACVILLSIFGFSACGGGGGGGSAPPPVASPPPPPPPSTDPTMTTEWAALVTRLDIRFTNDRSNLTAEQAAAPGPAGGNYYAAARDRFTGYVDSFWIYSYDQTVDWSNSSSLTFRQADVAVLLDDYRARWLTYMDGFINGLPLIDQIIRNAIRPVMSASVDDGYTDTMRLLEAWLIQSIAPPNISKIEGTWTTGPNSLAMSIQPNGKILGYDDHGCVYEGIVVVPSWIEPNFRVIMNQECGLASTILSGTILISNHNNGLSLLLNVSSLHTTIDTVLVR